MYDFFSAAEQSPIRLSRISLFNWGPYDGQVYTVDFSSKGNFIMGDNGSGKTTLYDAMSVLLTESRKAGFNRAAAQNSKSDRDLMSYIRGAYGSSNENGQKRTKYKRNKSVLTGIQALYKGSDGRHVSLSVLFYIKDGSTEGKDVQKWYLITHQDVSLKEVLDAFIQDKGRFRNWLMDNKIQSTATFKEYQELYGRSLCLSKNAVELLNRAAGLKQIDDLPKLLREFVLGTAGLDEDAKSIVDAHSENEKGYKKLQDYTEQENILSPLPKLATKIESTKQAREKIKAVQRAVPIYFAKLEIGELKKQKLVCENALKELENNIVNKNSQIVSCDEIIKNYDKQFMQLGGNQIEILQEKIKDLNDKITIKEENAKNYISICSILDIDGRVDWGIFNQNKENYEKNKQKLLDDNTRWQDDLFEVRRNLHAFQEEIKALKNEITTIEKSKSNICGDFQAIRQKLCKELGLLEDNVPYIGELLDVKDTEQQWQGAIERALGGLTNTLLVKESDQKKVTTWLNQNHTGLHIRLQVLKDIRDENHAPKAGGFIEKLNFKDHEFSSWLNLFLSKFDLCCVDHVDKTQMLPFSMTIEGLIQKEKGRFEKNDKRFIHDKKYWQLGFSNHNRLSLLNEELDVKSQEVKVLEVKFKELDEQIKSCHHLMQIWDKLSEIEWQNIDASFLENERLGLRNQLEQIQQAGGELSRIQQLMQEQKEVKINLEQERNTLFSQKGATENQLSFLVSRIDSLHSISSESLSLEQSTSLEDLYRKHTKLDNDNLIEVRQNCEQELNEALSKAGEDLQELNNKTIGVISRFMNKDKWRSIVVDWPKDLTALPEALAYLEKLRSDELSQKEKDYLDQVVKGSVQQLLNLSTEIESYKSTIKDKVERINQKLQEITFRRGSFLRLVVRDDRYPVNIEYDRLINTIASKYHSGAQPSEIYKYIGNAVEYLRKAVEGGSRTLDSLRLLEPSYQLSFFAEEYDENGQVIDELSSSSGKSGGEKESFAGIILAASLAYVLTPEGGNYPVFNTVFLDEAFSNTQESVSRAVMKAFVKLGLHLNLITPFKNQDLLDELEGNIIICWRDPVEHSSRVSNVSYEELVSNISHALH